jgi:hypothetical protein
MTDESLTRHPVVRVCQRPKTEDFDPVLLAIAE